MSALVLAFGEALIKGVLHELVLLKADPSQWDFSQSAKPPKVNARPVSSKRAAKGGVLRAAPKPERARTTRVFLPRASPPRPIKQLAPPATPPEPADPIEDLDLPRLSPPTPPPPVVAPVVLPPKLVWEDCPHCTLIAARNGTHYGALRCRACWERARLWEIAEPEGNRSERAARVPFPSERHAQPHRETPDALRLPPRGPRGGGTA